jgi:hypothetical protein
MENTPGAKVKRDGKDGLTPVRFTGKFRRLMHMDPFEITIPEPIFEICYRV